MRAPYSSALVQGDNFYYSLNTSLRAISGAVHVFIILRAALQENSPLYCSSTFALKMPAWVYLFCKHAGALDRRFPCEVLYRASHAKNQGEDMKPGFA